MSRPRGPAIPWTEAEDALLLKAVTAYRACPPEWWIGEKLPRHGYFAVRQRVLRKVRPRVPGLKSGSHRSQYERYQSAQRLCRETGTVHPFDRPAEMQTR